MVLTIAARTALAAQGLREVVADKGHHSNDVPTDLTALEIRSYINEPGGGSGAVSVGNNKRCMATGDGCAASGANGCHGCAVSGWNAVLLIYETRRDTA